MFLQIIIILALILYFKPNPAPYAGVYQRPGKFYYLKYAFIYLMIQLRKIQAKRGLSSDMPGYGVNVYNNYNETEKPQNAVLKNPKGADAVYFIAASRDGFYLTASIARRPNKIIDCIWLLKVPKVGLLQGLHHPDTRVQAVDGDTYATVEGLSIKPIVPMKKWQITFNGKMRLSHKPDKVLDVQVNLEYKSCVNVFNCDSDILPSTMARAIAREPWDFNYFQRLKDSHQVHYEQAGIIKGEINIENYGSFEAHLSTLRDHSIAVKRDWKGFHRYGNHFISLEDGTRFMVGIISQPVSLSNFEFGYCYTATGEMYGIDWCDLQLHIHGEGGTPPTDYAFKFKAGNKVYLVQCSVQDTPEIFIGEEWEARILERMCTFKVNGLDGWGFAEWHYRYRGGRPDEYSIDL